jgi:hypothetical protein
MENGKILSQTSLYLVAAFAIVTGLFAFLAVVGPRALYPSNIAWLAQGDAVAHYLGGVFFRNSEWSFPIGLNPTFGLELSNSIFYSDSNALFAIFFKVFSGFLPETFQYSGLLLLTCFILQAFFAYKLINLITNSPTLCMLGACLFLFAPPMLWRLQGHYNLVGHFFTVASLYLVLCPSPKWRIISWGALLMGSALTHAYILAMVGLIWIADMVDHLIKKILPIKRAALELFIIFGLTWLACWQAGYFSVVGRDASLGGFGFFRMNLLSIFDASGWSYMLRDIPEGGGDYEGFNYLGLGMIFLGICSLPSLFNAQTGVMRLLTKRPILLVAMLGLTVFALSNNVGIASVNFNFELPHSVMIVANIFRASGRMFWPVFYLIFFTIIFLIVRGYSKRVAITLLGLGLLIQIVDTSKMWLDIRTHLMAKPSSIWQTKMTDAFWNDAAAKYKKVRLLTLSSPPGLLGLIPPVNWQIIANYAASHKLSTDAVVLARVSKEARATSEKKYAATLLYGEFEPDSLYLLDETTLRQVAMTLDVQSDLLAQIDGFYVLAPGWKKCATCSKVLGEISVADQLPKRLRFGKRLLFSQHHSGSIYLGCGWLSQENWGVWSGGTDATIFLPLNVKQASMILVEAKPLLSISHPKQAVEVKINGIPTNSVILTADSGGKFEVVIPAEVKEQLKHKPLLKLQLHFPDAARPVDIGINRDERKLAIGLVALTVQ